MEPALSGCAVRHNRPVQADGAYVIRTAVEGDADAVATLSLIAQEFHRQAAPDRFKTADKAALVAAFAEDIGSSDVVILLAETSGEAAGYVFAKVNAQPETALTYAHNALHVHQLAVSPAHRRGGVARALMRAVEAEAVARRIEEITLVHWDFNRSAANLFESLGYAGQSHRMHKRLSDAV